MLQISIWGPRNKEWEKWDKTTTQVWTRPYEGRNRQSNEVAVMIPYTDSDPGEIL